MAWRAKSSVFTGPARCDIRQRSAGLAADRRKMPRVAQLRWYPQAGTGRSLASCLFPAPELRSTHPFWLPPHLPATLLCRCAARGSDPLTKNRTVNPHPFPSPPPLLAVPPPRSVIAVNCSRGPRVSRAGVFCEKKPAIVSRKRGKLAFTRLAVVDTIPPQISPRADYASNLPAAPERHHIPDSRGQGRPS